jgi:transcription elongation factor SPT5
VAPRKRKHRRGSEFIDDTAAVASDEEEEEEDEEEDFIDHGNEIVEEGDSRRSHHRPMLPRDDQEGDVEDLEKFIQQRYGRQVGFGGCWEVNSESLLQK